MSWRVEALCTGQPLPFRGEELSAFAKQPVAGPVRIKSQGLEGDVQADRRHHGGPDMALHLYPLAHHRYWDEELAGHELLTQPGAFGSNLAVDGLTEHDVRLGDRFRLGSAFIEISQPRMPCWKIEHRFDRAGMVATIIATARCGWYFRVIEQGSTEAGDMLVLVETDRTPWTIAEVFSELVNPHASSTRARIGAMAGCTLLAPAWRERAGKVLAGLG